MWIEKFEYNFFILVQLSVVLRPGRVTYYKFTVLQAKSSQRLKHTNIILKESWARNRPSLIFHYNYIISVTRAEGSYSWMEYSEIYILLLENKKGVDIHPNWMLANAFC